MLYRGNYISESPEDEPSTNLYGVKLYEIFLMGRFTSVKNYSLSEIFDEITSRIACMFIVELSLELLLAEAYNLQIFILFSFECVSYNYDSYRGKFV